MKTVRELAEDIDARLVALTLEKGRRAACEEAMRVAEVAVAEAEEGVLHARIALFEAYPELLGGDSIDTIMGDRGKVGVVVTADERREPVYEAIEVDDADALPRGERIPIMGDDGNVGDLADLWDERDG